MMTPDLKEAGLDMQATPEQWDAVRDLLEEQAPDLVAMVLGDEDHHLGTGAMKGTRDRRRAIARLERTKGATS